jgi:hypothetical protein
MCMSTVLAIFASIVYVLTCQFLFLSLCFAKLGCFLHSKWRLHSSITITCSNCEWCSQRSINLTATKTVAEWSHFARCQLNVDFVGVTLFDTVAKLDAWVLSLGSVTIVDVVEKVILPYFVVRNFYVYHSS